MRECPIHARFAGPIVMIGFGSIGKGTLPLILRHIDAPRERMVVIDADDSARNLAECEGVRFRRLALTRDNLRRELSPLLAGGGFCVNLSVEVSSVALIALCREVGALYIDTCVEPWPGGYTDPSLSPTERSNYGLREAARSLRRPGIADPTALLAHGANPGMVSHFVKQALLNLAEDLGHQVDEPRTQAGWARLARDLGVKGVHIAERDTQRASMPKRRASSSTPGRSRAFSAKACSQPSSVGARTSAGCRPRPAAILTAAMPPSTLIGPGVPRACAPGHRPREPRSPG